MENQQSTLPDQYVVLLEKVIEGNRKISDENKVLREIVANRNDSLVRLEEKLKTAIPGNVSQPTVRRRCRPRVQVPLLCRVRLIHLEVLLDHALCRSSFSRA